MSATYHPSVRHYHAPFPLTHRNSRPFASPTSHQGPWGAVHHEELTETSPLSKTFDRRNQSSVPLPSPGSGSRSRQSHKQQQQQRAPSPWHTTDPSLPSSPLGGSSSAAGGPCSSLHHNGPISGAAAATDPLAHSTSALYETLGGSSEGGLFSTVRSDGWDRRGDFFASQQPYNADERGRNLGGGFPTPLSPEGRLAHGAATSDEQCDECDGDSNGAPTSPVRGRNVGEFSALREQRRLAEVVPGEYDPPNTLRLATRRVDPMSSSSMSPQGAAAGDLLSSGTMMSGVSPRRRQPPRVPVGYVYKSTTVPGLNAPTHVQIPMGFRVVSHRPQIPAKVTQYSPWKPMDQQHPLPTLEGHYSDGSSYRHQDAHHPNVKPFSSDDASLRYASKETLQMIAAGVSASPEQHYRTVVATSRLGRGVGTCDGGVAAPDLLADYAKAQRTQPPVPHGSPGWEVSPFETSRKTFSRKNSSNVPLSPTRTRKSSAGGGEASGSSVSGLEPQHRQASTSDSAPNIAPSKELSPRSPKHPGPHSSPSSPLVPRQGEFVNASTTPATHVATPATSGRGGNVVGSGGGDREVSLHEYYEGRFDGSNGGARDAAAWSGEYGRGRAAEEYDRPPQFGTGGDDNEDDAAVIRRGRSRASPYAPQAPILPEGWTGVLPYALPQHKAPVDPSTPRRRQPPRVPVGYVYKSTTVPGLNAPTHVQIPMGFRVVSHRPQIPAKVTQYSPWKPMDQQQPLPTLEGHYGATDAQHPSAARGVERIPATPLITEVDERLAAQGLGSLLDIRNASDERISHVLASIGFGPSDRMSILWQLRRRHPSSAS